MASFKVTGVPYGATAMALVCSASSQDGRAPFSVTLDLHVELGRDASEQLLVRALARGRERPGKRLTADEVAKQYPALRPACTDWFSLRATRCC